MIKSCKVVKPRKLTYQKSSVHLSRDCHLSASWEGVGAPMNVIELSYEKEIYEKSEEPTLT